jgi:predicted secreted protein
MAARIGRKVVFTWNGSPVEGVREKGLACNGEPIDITSDDSDGVRELLAESGQDGIDLSISGVTKDDILRKAWFDGRVTPEARMGVVTMTYPNGAIIAGTFRLNTYNENEPYNDATTFESELQSSGAFTYTPGA